MSMVDVSIAVMPRVPVRLLTEDDAALLGTYTVRVSPGLSSQRMAAVALDVFHAECGIDEVDDLAIYVYDAASGRLMTQEETHKLLTHLGQDLTKTSSTYSRVYEVTLDACASDGKRTKLGTVVVVAPNEPTAKELGCNALWDERLTGASCTASIEVTLLA